MPFVRVALVMVANKNHDITAIKPQLRHTLTNFMRHMTLSVYGIRCPSSSDPSWRGLFLPLAGQALLCLHCGWLRNHESMVSGGVLSCMQEPVYHLQAWEELIPPTGRWGPLLQALEFRGLQLLNLDVSSQDSRYYFSVVQPLT